VPVVPYRRPGSREAGDVIASVAAESSAVLIANHGPVATGKDLASAVFAIEEIEEAAKLVLLTKDLKVRLLDREAVEDLNSTFKYR
jgi:ribulose-5-phosphate 4-epimerase/fuculose-1-phosphate aldolase